MRSKLLIFLLLMLISVLIAGTGACSKNTAEITTAKASEQVTAAPADRDISAALALIEKMPDSTLALNQLAILYIKKARETGDFEYNAKAESAVRKALSIAPEDSATRKLQASLHLTFHRFGDALELGNQLIQEVPNDSFIYGVLTDANAELGNYEEAVAAAQKMVDLKPNSNSYARVAHLRSLHGDHAGAVEMYKLAARTADPSDKEAQSWCLTQLGDEFWKNGKYKEAEAVYDEALHVLPNYYLALEGKGRIRAAQRDFAGAESFLTEAQNRFPSPRTIVELARVYGLQGNVEKADAQFQLLEVVDQKLGVAGDQKDLALSWADRDMKLDEAVEIAASEYKARKDVYTADVYAWCLYKQGRFAEAKEPMANAMRLKTGDARFLYHAGMIEKALGNKKEAVRLIGEAVKLNPSFDLVQTEKANEALTALK